MNKIVELVFVPTPILGHLLSAVQVAKLIVQRYEQISISIHIINLSTHSAEIKAYVDSQSRYNPYAARLTFVTLPPPSNPPEVSSPYPFVEIIKIHKPLVRQVVEDRIRDGFPKPVGFVLDMFCANMVDIANELKIPSFVYFTSGASFLNFIFYAQSLVDDHGLDARDIAMKFSDPEFSALIPGFKNPITCKNVPSVFQDAEFGCPMVLDFARRFKEMKGILVNSHVELEKFAIETLLHASDDKNIPTIYPVGPIILELKTGGGLEDKVKKYTIEWLDNQPESSVVFLCFGSMGSFNEEQVKEIAHGLEGLGCRFLWAFRKPPANGTIGGFGDNAVFLEALPDGFLDRTMHRGKIIGWAPQIEILAHPAIGGFVSHCGWNSTLESLWFGVPIATWPMFAEQRLNAFELVKELELAVDIRMDYTNERSSVGNENSLVTSTEIKDGVLKLMSMNDKMRGRVKEISNKGKKTLKDGGSSSLWLSCFIKDVLNNVA